MMDKLYTVATNDFMAAGGDGYDMLKAYPIKAEYNTLMDTLLDYVKKLGTVEGKLEQRITFDTESGADALAGIREFAVAKGYKVDYDAKAKAIVLTAGDKVITIDVKANRYVAGEVKGSFANAPMLQNGHWVYQAKDLNAMFNAK